MIMNRTVIKHRHLMKGLMALLIALSLGNEAMAQEQLSRRQQADQRFNRFEYYNAARLYLPLAEKKNPDVKLLEKLAACYRMMNEYGDAEKWYARAVENPKAEPLSHYYYAEALQRNHQFEDAKAQYQLYGSRNGQVEAMAVKIASCDSAALWMKEPGAFTVKNVATLNTALADWGLNYYGNDGLVFTSERNSEKERENSNVYQWNGNPWLRLFLASPDGQPKEELPAVNKQNWPAKTGYHVGPMAVNAAGDVAYVTISTTIRAVELPLDKTGKKTSERLYTRRLELLSAVKKDGKWGDLKSFPYNNVKAYSIGHASLSKDGKVLYFTSDMPGGFGETDIWYSELQTDGSWGQPQNCGPEINTAAEEAFPSTGVNGELYFSSKGRIGMGGFDIYSSKGEKARWTKAQNLKYPVNTTSDDFYFVTNDGQSGYFSSNRQGGAGDDDIYSFNAIPKPVIVFALSGIVLDKKTKESLDEVTVILTDPQGGTISQKLTAQNGQYFFALNKDQDYKVELSRTGYSSATEILSTKGLSKSDTLKLTTHLDKAKFEQGKTYVLKNIYYDFDRAGIRPDASRELDKLVTILKENPTLWIELAAHTDSRGDDLYNQWLSERRANSAMKYLVEKGIDQQRLTAKGYGETMLLNKCSNGVKCSAADHQLNRRTEFKVIRQ